MIRILAFLVLVLPGLATAQPARENLSLPELESAIRSHKGSGDPAKAAEIAHRIKASMQAATAAGDDRRARKLALLESLHAAPGLDRLSLESVAVDLHMQVPQDASRCEAALPVRAETRHALHPQSSAGIAVTWLNFTAPRAGTYRVSTFGSEGDPRLEVWSSCAQRPGEMLASNDDYLGLAALLPLQAERAGQSFFLRLDNDFPRALQQISIVEGGGYTISGRVTADGIPVPNLTVLAATPGGQYMGTAYTSSVDGFYSLYVNDPVDVMLRTNVWPNDNTPYMMVAHPDRPCYTRESWSIVDHCGGAAGITVFRAAQAPHSNVDFNLTLGGTIVGTVSTEVLGTSAEVKVRELGQTVSRTRYTDQWSRYQLRGLPPGNYLVEAGANSHVREIHDNVPCVSGVCDPGLATPVAVAVGSMAVVNFDLEDLRRLSVEVSGLEPDALVYLGMLNEYGGYQNSVPAYANQAGIARALVDQPSGPFRLYITGSTLVSQVYPAVLCSAENCAGQLIAGELLQMPAGGTLSLSMQATIRPRVSGRIRDAGNGSPLANVEVRALSVGAYFYTQSAYTGADGSYFLERVYPGNYLVHARSAAHIDELYPNVPCQTVNSPVTDCSGGTILNVTASGLQEIDFDLDASAVIEGSVFTGDGASANQLSVTVGSVAPDGSVRVTTGVGMDGRYRLTDLMSGEARIGAFTYNSFDQIFPTLYDGVYCPRPQNTGVPFAACAGGTIFQITPGSVRTGIDMLVIGASSRLVQVSRTDSGQPVAGVVVDFWDVGMNWLGAAMTNAQGYARVQRYSGSSSVPLLLSTSNGIGLVDEVYDNIACPDGSAYFGLCSLSGATPVDSWNPSPTSPPIRFELSPAGTDSVWAHGFED